LAPGVCSRQFYRSYLNFFKLGFSSKYGFAKKVDPCQAKRGSHKKLPKILKKQKMEEIWKK
jgi:hypothetical protein